MTWRWHELIVRFTDIPRDWHVAMFIDCSIFLQAHRFFFPYKSLSPPGHGTPHTQPIFNSGGKLSSDSIGYWYKMTRFLRSQNHKGWGKKKKRKKNTSANISLLFLRRKFSCYPSRTTPGTTWGHYLLHYHYYDYVRNHNSFAWPLLSWPYS